MILHNGAIAFVGFYHQPITIADFGITDFSLTNNARQSGTADNARFKSGMLHNIKNHGRSGAFARSSSYSYCFFTFRYQCQYLRSFQNGYIQFPGLFDFKYRIFNGR